MPKKNNFSQEVRDWLIADREKRPVSSIVDHGGSLPLQQRILDFVILLSNRQRELLLNYLRLKFELAKGAAGQQQLSQQRHQARIAFTSSLSGAGSRVNSRAFRTLEAEVNALIINHNPDNQALDSAVFFFSFGMTGKSLSYKLDPLIIENVVKPIANHADSASKYHKFIRQETLAVNHRAPIATAKKNTMVDDSRIDFQSARQVIRAFLEKYLGNLLTPRDAKSTVVKNRVSLQKGSEPKGVIASNDGNFSSSIESILPQLVVDSPETDIHNDDEKQQAKLEAEALTEQQEQEAQHALLIVEEQRRLEQEKLSQKLALQLELQEQALFDEQKVQIEKDKLLAIELSEQFEQQEREETLLIDERSLDSDAILAFQEQTKHIIQILASHSAEQSLMLLEQHFTDVSSKTSVPLDDAEFRTTNRTFSVMLSHHDEWMKVNFSDSTFINKKTHTKTRDIDARIENTNYTAADNHWFSSDFGEEFHYQEITELSPSLATYDDFTFHQSHRSCGVEANNAHSSEYDNGLIC